MNILYKCFQSLIDSLSNLYYIMHYAYDTIYDEDFPKIDFLEEQ
jgi:hypothetical protein